MGETSNGGAVVKKTLKEWLDEAHAEQVKLDRKLDRKLDGVPLQKLKGLPDRMLVAEIQLDQHARYFGIAGKLLFALLGGGVMGVAGLVFTLWRLLPTLQSLAGAASGVGP